jgi:hypothetical protein
VVEVMVAVVAETVETEEDVVEEDAVLEDWERSVRSRPNRRLHKSQRLGQTQSQTPSKSRKRSRCLFQYRFRFRFLRWECQP